MSCSSVFLKHRRKQPHYFLGPLVVPDDLSEQFHNIHLQYISDPMDDLPEYVHQIPGDVLFLRLCTQHIKDAAETLPVMPLLV